MQTKHSVPSTRRILATVPVALALAYFSAAQSLAIVSEHSRPAMAYRFAPWDGVAEGNLAQALYQTQVSAKAAAASVRPDREANKLALGAVKKEPMLPSAWAIVGASQSGEQAQQFWSLAASISRRDNLLQGMLLKYYGETDDLANSIKVLNQILSVNLTQRPALFSLLAKVLRNPKSVPTFVDILAAKPDWGDAFMISAARDPEAVDSLAEVLRKLPGKVTNPQTEAALLYSFTKSGHLDLAYDLYSHLQAQRVSDDIPWNSDLAPFDWKLADDAGFRAQRDADSDELRVNIVRGKGGVLASRILPAKNHVIEISGYYDFDSEQRARRLGVSVLCMGQQQIVGAASFADGKISLRTVLPVGCDFVRVFITGRAWSDAERISGTIAPLRISFHS